MPYLESLPNWNNLSRSEQKRLRTMYGQEPDIDPTGHTMLTPEDEKFAEKVNKEVPNG